MITTSPRRYSSAASSTVAKGMGRIVASRVSGLPRHLETLLHRIRLLRHGIDDLHLQRVVARLEGRFDFGQRDGADDGEVARTGDAGERKRSGVAERRADGFLVGATGEVELVLELGHVRGRIDARVVDL